jgi:hypothetical protein
MVFGSQKQNTRVATRNFTICISIVLKPKLSHHTPWRRLWGGGEEEVQLLLILELYTRWDEWSASLSGRALPPGKGPPILIGQEAGWAPRAYSHVYLFPVWVSFTTANTIISHMSHWAPNLLRRATDLLMKEEYLSYLKKGQVMSTKLFKTL